MGVIIKVLIVAIAAYLFLVAPRMWGGPDRTDFYEVHYAHRGLFDNKSNAPENSLNAIKKAVEEGYGIEFDVQLSKDDIPVVFHDATLKRMCGVDGNVWDYTLEELQQMKLLNSDQTIPTFAEVLEIVGGKVPLIIEYKMDRVDTKVCELTNKILENYKGAYCIESFHPFALVWYKKNRPDVLRGQLAEEYESIEGKGKIALWCAQNLLTNVIARPDFIAYNHKHASNFSRRVCRRLGALSVTYTIKSQQEYENAKRHFDLFIFDSFILESPR